MCKRPIAWLVLLALATGCHAKRVKELEAELVDRDAAVQQLQVENDGWRVEVETLQAELRRLERKNAELAAYYQDLLDELAPRLDDGDVELVLYPDRSVLALAPEIHFRTGSAQLSADGQRAVDELAELLRQHPDRRFQVEGHTDPRPISTARYPSNWELGAGRAITIVKALIDRGIAEERLSAATYAATAPVADNRTPDGQADNRRIAVALQLSVDDLPAHQALLERAKRAGHARAAASTRERHTAQRD